MLNLINNFIKKNTKYKIQDYVIGSENKFNYKFKNTDIIILNQYLLKIIKINKIFNNNEEILKSEILLNKELILKPIIKKRKKKIIKEPEKILTEKEKEKLKIVDYFSCIDKQNHNKVMTENFLNNIYILLNNYQNDLKEKGLADDVFYKYNKNKLYDYCKKYNIKLKKIKEEDFIKEDSKEDKSGALSEEFFNIFGENIKI